MNHAGVCTSVKIFVLFVCACVIERQREKGHERVHVLVKMRHLNEHVLVHCTQQCITFTHNLPDSNAMLLSGGVPGYKYKESDVKLLASTIIEHTIWELYLQAAATTSMREVAYPTFTSLAAA